MDELHPLASLALGGCPHLVDGGAALVGQCEGVPLLIRSSVAVGVVVVGD